MDPLSEVLVSTRITGAVYRGTRLRAPWALSSPPPGQLGRATGPDAECISFFHLVARGCCWIALADLPPIEVVEGSIVILPHGSAHVIASQPGLEPRPVAGAPCRRAVGPGRGEQGDRGDVSRLACGYLRCDQRLACLMGSLPLMLVVHANGELTLTGQAGCPRAADGRWNGEQEWLRAVMARVRREADADQPGGPAMLARLTELLLVTILRRHMASVPAPDRGWLAAVRDPDIGRALELMHGEPERKWTVTVLARESHLSRSALAQRFTTLVGEPPMHYLASWRMQLARALLREPRLSTAQIAGRVGYESEVGFHRAFKRIVGMPPAAWRSADDRLNPPAGAAPFATD